MPSIREARTKIIDKTYRDIEAGSEFRAQAAAEMTGAPVSEMSSLKITNLSDRRDSEVAAMPIVNDVTRRMDEIRARGLPIGYGVPNASEYSAAVQQGPSPNMGARMRAAVQEQHPQAVAKHCIGINEAGRAIIPSTDVVSQRDALEVQQPGYRRRA